jgi:hypothetical protein
MKFILCFVTLISLVLAANVCFQIPVTCTDVANCNLNCQGTLATILNNVQTLEQVWQWTIRDLGNSWTVVQTQDPTWYSNWKKAAICTCVGYETIFVQQ